MDPDKDNKDIDNLLREVFEMEKVFPGRDFLTEMINNAESGLFLCEDDLKMVVAAQGLNPEEYRIRDEILKRIKRG